MKKLLLPLLLITYIINPALAQKAKKNMYMKAGIGYGLPYGGSTEGYISSAGLHAAVQYSGTYHSISNSNGYFEERFKMARNSFYSGTIGTVGFGIWFSKNIGFELAGNVGLSAEEKKSNHREFLGTDMSELEVNQKAKYPIMLTPSILLQSGGNVRLFTRVGIVLPIKTSITQEILLTNKKYNAATHSHLITQYRLEEKYKMRFNPGVAAALGLIIKVKGPVNVWVEAGILSMSMYYKKSELLKFEYDGRDYLNTFHKTERNTEYTFDNVSSTKNEKPTSQVPFHNMSLSAGISLTL